MLLESAVSQVVNDENNEGKGGGGEERGHSSAKQMEHMEAKARALVQARRNHRTAHNATFPVSGDPTPPPGLDLEADLYY
eukprot:245563-Prorocentrum_minimum.AAC.1